jgi:hypothetical protein
MNSAFEDERGPSMSFQPLAQGLKNVKVKSDGPPEPPTRPLDGPVFEKRGDFLYCKIPGCSKAARAFDHKNGMAIHVARRHGLNLDGLPSNSWGNGRPPAAPPPPPKPPVSVRGIIVGTEGSLIAQAIRIVETAKVNLGGKLSEMNLLQEKADRLEVILTYMRELV